MLDRGHADRAHRVPEHRLAGQRRVLLGPLAGEACAATRSRDQGEQRQVKVLVNSGRYNYTVFPPMHRDSLPAHRRYTRLSGSSDALALSRLASSEKPLAVISATALDAQRLVDEVAWFSPGLRVCLLPDWETLPYDHFSPHQDLVSERLATLYRVARGECDVLVVAATTALYRLAPPSYLAAFTFFLRTGERLDVDALRAQLALAGYQNVTQVVSPGEFSIRGGLIDLYAMGSVLPYRIDLFGDDIESIKTFDADTQRTLYPVPEVRLLPAREFPVDETGRTRFRGRYREVFEGDPLRSPLYKDVSN